MKGISPAVKTTNPVRAAQKAVLPAVKILVADPSAQTRKILADKLLEQDARSVIFEAETGRDIARLMLTKNPDMVFVSVEMPDISGAEAIAHAQKKGAHPLVIMMSGRVTPHWTAMSKELCAYEFLKKPLDPSHVGHMLTNYRRLKEQVSVLVVDGSILSLQIVRRILNSSLFNLDIHETDNAQHAIKSIKLASYDLLIVDLATSGMAGLELACQLEMHQPQSKIVLMAQEGSTALANMGPLIGFRAVLMKPFYANDVDAALHTLFGLRRPYLLNATASETVRVSTTW
jgi:DNA-binding NtrC family response regulator